MNIVILVYDGIDIWDLAFAYKAFSSLEEASIVIATNNDTGEIICKDKNLVLGGFSQVYNLEEADILWICQGETMLERLRKDSKFMSKINQLSRSAKKIVCVGGSSIFLIDSFIDKEKSVSCHPVFSRRIKKAKLNYVPDLMLDNETLITCSSRIGLLFAIDAIYKEFFHESDYLKLLKEFHLDSIDSLSNRQEDKKRIKSLKKLYKQSLKIEANKNILQLKVDEIKNSFGFYVQDNFDFFSFAIAYSLLSNGTKQNNYIIGDKKGRFPVQGGHFYVKSTHSLYQIQRVGTLIISGGSVIEHRLAESFLKYWIYSIVPKVSRIICLDGSDRLLGVSGVLVDYDPVLESNGGESFRKDGKYIFLQNGYELMNYLSFNLKKLIGEKQADLLKGEYFL